MNAIAVSDLALLISQKEMAARHAPSPTASLRSAVMARSRAGET